MLQRASIKYLILLLFMLCPKSGFSQTNEWTHTIGDNYSAHAGNATAVDASGNVYVTGYTTIDSQNIYRVNFDLGYGSTCSDGSISTTCGWLYGGYNRYIFVVKYDASGILLWNFAIIAGDSAQGSSIAVDGIGNVYVTGHFAGSFNGLYSNGSTDIFIAKFDASGNYLWAKVIGGSNQDEGKSIAVDASGNVYVAGYFMNTADFNPGTGTANLTSNVSYDIFIAKYDTNGNYLWAHGIGGPVGTESIDKAFGLALDASGNVYVTGHFSGSNADFDPGAGTANLTSNADVVTQSYHDEDIFIAKYDTNGNYLWAKGIGGSGGDVGNSIAVDSSGNVYVTGSFFNTVDFDPSSGTANLTSFSVSSTDWSDIFVAKYDASGNYLWAKRMGIDYTDIGHDIAVDDNGNVFVTGEGWLPEVSHDIFFAQYDTNGNHLFAHTIGGMSVDHGYGIAVDDNGNAYVTGRLQGDILFAKYSYSTLLADGESCTAANQCSSDACDACGHCGTDNPTECLADGASCTASNQCSSNACDTCSECGTGNPTSCYPDGTTCTVANQCSSDACDACGHCGTDNPTECLVDGSSCTASNQCSSNACDACGECGTDNPTECLADGASCTAANQCSSDTCDACGHCGTDNPTSCLADGASCTAANQCSSNACDACSECGTGNPTSCYADGTTCTAANQCSSDSCDACGQCGTSNPTVCLSKLEECTASNQCSADACDACGECGGNNPVSCLLNGSTCTADNQCSADACDACGQCGGNNTACYSDGASCFNANECSSDTCDACGQCGTGNPTSCLVDGQSCTAANQCAADACDACGECGTGNPTSCLVDGQSCTAANQCAADACDACGECGGNNTACYSDGASCFNSNECSSDTCDACGECSGNNPVSCLADEASCTAANQCSADICDACSECGTSNPIACLADGSLCITANQCAADSCDACGKCGGNNVFCYANGFACNNSNECQTDYCDACGECGGNNPVSCLTNGVTCINANECQSDYCDVCGECGGNNLELCRLDGEACFSSSQCQSDSCDACSKCGGNNTACYIDGASCSNANECQSDTCDACSQCGNVNSCIPLFSSITSFTNNILPLHGAPMVLTFSIALNATSVSAVSVSSSLQNTNMASEITIVDENTLQIELSKLQANDVITISLDASKIVSVDGNYTMSDISLADTSFTYNVSYLGDYNHSGNSEGTVLDAADIDTLVTYWGSTKYEYELGPCLGGPCLPANLPTLIPAFDGKWNIEDIMSFYIMWNYTTVASRTLSRTHMDNIGHPITLYFENNNLIMELPEYNKDVHHIWYQLYMPGNDATYNASDLKESFDLTLQRQSEDKSIKQWSLVQLDGTSTLDKVVLGSIDSHTKKDEVIDFQYKITSKDKILSSGSMALEYKPIPDEYALHQAYPNPFNPITTLSFALPIETEVSLSIYNLQGREIISLIQGNMEAGYHSITWNATMYSSGIYFVRLHAGSFNRTQKLMLIK